ncbi:MAG: hypothetical protein WDN46_04890 [Methylocella sp.]
MATRIGAMRTVVCASPKLIAGHGRPEKPEDLAALPTVTFDFLTGHASPEDAGLPGFCDGLHEGEAEVPLEPDAIRSNRSDRTCMMSAAGTTAVLFCAIGGKLWRPGGMIESGTSGLSAIGRRDAAARVTTLT